MPLIGSVSPAQSGGIRWLLLVDHMPGMQPEQQQVRSSRDRFGQCGQGHTTE